MFQCCSEPLSKGAYAEPYEQTTPLLSPEVHDKLSEIELDTIATKEVHNDSDRALGLTDDSMKLEIPEVDEEEPQSGCFKTSPSSHSLSRECKQKSENNKCIVECENGATYIADHVIVTCSLGNFCENL